MRQVAIRCQPATAASPEVEQWIGDEVERLRAAMPHGSIRVHRITTTQSAEDVGTGWLIELDATSGGELLDGESVDALVRDLRLLGLRPTLLRTFGNGDMSAGPRGERSANRGRA